MALDLIKIRRNNLVTTILKEYCISGVGKEQIQILEKRMKIAGRSGKVDLKKDELTSKREPKKGVKIAEI
jgi:hypothetical protein